MPVKKIYSDPNTRCNKNHEPDWYISPKGWVVCKQYVEEKHHLNLKRSIQKDIKNINEKIELIIWRKGENMIDSVGEIIQNVESKKELHFSETKYGLQYEEYQVMWDKQKGLCQICNRPLLEVRGSKGAAVDHDHATGKVRDILCGRCNSVVGFCEEDVDLMQKFISYIEIVWVR